MVVVDGDRAPCGPKPTPCLTRLPCLLPQIEELKLAIVSAMIDLLKLYEDSEAQQLQVTRKKQFYKLLGECATSLIR